jgi:nitrile hydratase accessory protein
MAERAAPRVDLEGAAAPPRANGELVFAAPWESRVFGITMALHAQGRFDWEEFRSRLIAEIAAWERTHPDGAPYRYYERWLAALESLLTATGLCEPTALDAAAEELAARPAGHDHAR